VSHDPFHHTWTSLKPGKEATVKASWDQVYSWFKQLNVFPKLIWKGRENSTCYFCVGIGSSGNALPNFPKFTVRAFDGQQPQWQGFPAALEWTPYGVLEIPSKHRNIGSEAVAIQISKAKTQSSWSPPEGHSPEHRTHVPSQALWTSNIETSKQLFQDTTLRKIVLARESYFEFSDPWTRFIELQLSQPDNYHFLFSPEPETIFLGASPEKLFSTSGTILKTEALAGTRSVSNNKTENKALAEDLNQSSKDQTEHHIVVHYIHQQLKDLCTEQRSLKQEVLELPHVQHLRTPIECILHPNTTTSQLLDRLHPTPAVCGIPKTLARKTIAKLEPFHRGWYAGTMGIEHGDAADFTVLIRSALWKRVSNEHTAGYAWSGAGIVEESDPISEWIEIGNKAKQFVQQETS